MRQGLRFPTGMPECWSVHVRLPENYRKHEVYHFHFTSPHQNTYSNFAKTGGWRFVGFASGHYIRQCRQACFRCRRLERLCTAGMTSRGPAVVPKHCVGKFLPRRNLAATPRPFPDCEPPTSAFARQIAGGEAG